MALLAPTKETMEFALAMVRNLIGTLLPDFLEETGGPVSIATDDGAAVDSTERVYVNVFRTKGKCEYGKSAPGPRSMGWN